MKVGTLTVNGIKEWRPIVVWSPKGAYYALTAGEQGRGRWEYRLPLASKDFPVTGPSIGPDGRCEVCGTIVIGPFSAQYPTDPVKRAGLTCPACATRDLDLDVIARPTGRLDGAGQEIFVLTRSEAPGWLVRLCTSPGFRGGSSFEVSGNASVLGQGREAQGAAGRMGGGPVPVIAVTGPAEIRWKRGGRLYGAPDKYVAVYADGSWSVRPADEAELDELAHLDY